MARGNGFTAQQFIDAIPGSAGIITVISKRVGCAWNTTRKYIDQYATVRQAYDDECESILDLAEGKLYESVKGGEISAIKYLLSTKGKRRGYYEKREVEQTGEQRLVIVEEIVDANSENPASPDTESVP